MSHFHVHMTFFHMIDTLHLLTSIQLNYFMAMIEFLFSFASFLTLSQKFSVNARVSQRGILVDQSTFSIAWFHEC